MRTKFPLRFFIWVCMCVFQAEYRLVAHVRCGGRHILDLWSGLERVSSSDRLQTTREAHYPSERPNRSQPPTRINLLTRDNRAGDRLRFLNVFNDKIVCLILGIRETAHECSFPVSSNFSNINHALAGNNGSDTRNRDLIKHQEFDGST